MRLPTLALLLACYATAASAPTTTVAADDPWLTTLTALLTDHFQPTGDLTLAWARPRPAAAPADADLVLTTVPPALSSQFLLNVRATSAAGATTDHTLVLRAELWRDGWTLREPASVQSPLIPHALDFRRFDALRDRDAIPADPALELDFARTVPAGRLLTWRDVVRRPMVRRGQPVEVTATNGPLTVTLRAIALHDAARGDTLRVRNPDTKKDFTAQVTSESRATVRF